MMNSPKNSEPALRLVLDTDPGVDDAIAILLALAAPEAEVVGLTTLGGNVPRARATRNALALLQAAGRAEVPVARGAARPLSGRFHPSVKFHGPGGLSARLPDPSTEPVQQTAVDFLSESIETMPGEVSVVALGPLTNIARLEQLKPGILNRCASVVVMGGAVGAPGNVSPRAEFNFQSDPLAAAQVMGSGTPIVLADLSACRQVGICREQAMGLSSEGLLGGLALQMLQGWFARDDNRERFEFYDPLAVALALEPAIATTRSMSLTVGTSPDEHWGESTAIDEPGVINLACQIDSSRFFVLLKDLFGWRGL